MREEGKPEPGCWERTAGALILLVLSGLIGGALSIPFVYETQTIWYKSGLERWLLRAGQMAGLLALLLLLLQVVLALRLTVLERIFGSGRLLRWHRQGGLLLTIVAGGHLLLVQAPEGLANWPTGLEYWPEMVGMGLFVLLVLHVLLAQLRTSLGIGYRPWQGVHRIAAYLLLPLALIHVLFVSESFAGGLPRWAVLLLFAALAAAVAFSKRGAAAGRGQGSPGTKQPKEEQ